MNRSVTDFCWPCRYGVTRRASSRPLPSCELCGGPVETLTDKAIDSLMRQKLANDDYLRNCAREVPS